MRAMILAAGFGTRLSPLTDKIPKALIPVGGKPLLEILLNKLLAQGFEQIAVNAHHHADKVSHFIKHYSRKEKVKIAVSLEKKILDTGGGIKRMCRLLPGEKPVLVHNVDVLSSIDLSSMYRHFEETDNSALLAVLKHPSPRSLVFDQRMNLVGKNQVDKENIYSRRRSKGSLSVREFCGIQVISPKLFTTFPGEKFSSIDVYLQSAERGSQIKGYAVDSCYWRDVGRFDDLEAAERDLASGKITLKQIHPEMPPGADGN
ncbi:nucleotidyltransferase family protein [candidate division KSB1 bacterium]|nr:nucleotidyltransferase family protein [candidate division KSB1 bacterium]